MEKSTQRFLALLLCLAMLLSFPMAASASQKSYEETFTGTYTAPLNARNVLVSGATVSEWYGDRVNMGGHTYSVRQDEYGLNKDGNMLDAELGQRYTLWLAQYGVASIQFTAPADGKYSFKSAETEYGHAPNYLELNVYSLREKEDSDIGGMYYSLRDYQYGRYNREADTDENIDAYLVMEMSAGETVYIAADADTDDDYVYSFEINEWSAENCLHSWRYRYDDDVVHQERCTVDRLQYCEYCGKERTIEEPYHNYEYKVEPLENDMFRYYDECTVCGDILDDYTSRHHYVYQYIATDDANHDITEQYVCEGCGDVKYAHSYVNHQWELVYEQEGCDVYEMERCSVCGEIRDRYILYSEHEWETVEEHIEGCHYEQVERCSICGEESYREPTSYHGEIEEYVEPLDTCYYEVTCVCKECGEVTGVDYEYRHNLDYDNVVYIDDCIDAYVCLDCGETVYDDHHCGDFYDEYETEGCVTYCNSYCTECGRIIYTYEAWTDHLSEFNRYYDEESGNVCADEYCSRCGEFLGTTVVYDKDDYDGIYAVTPDSELEVSIASGRLSEIIVYFEVEELGTYYFYSHGGHYCYGSIYDNHGDYISNQMDSRFYEFQYGVDCEPGETYWAVIQVDPALNLPKTIVFGLSTEQQPNYTYIEGQAYIVEEFKEFINGTNCYNEYTVYTCIDDPDKSFTTQWDYHKGWRKEFVQLSPQHDDVCGTYQMVCPDCGTVRDEEDVCHTYKNRREGCLYVKTCSRCGDVVEFGDHADYEDDDLITEASTCQTTGRIYYICEDCGLEITVEELPLADHTLVTVEGYPETCTTSGLTDGKYCSVCGETIQEQAVIPAIGHSYNLKETIEPTCTLDGRNIYQCIRCDSTYIETIPATGHTIVTDEAVEPTCTESGLTEGKHCGKCGMVIIAQDVIAPTGHRAVSTPAVAATCTESGLTEGSHCSVCGTIIEAQETIPATGHTIVTDKAVEPTCTESGLTEGAHCSKCGTIIEAQQTIPANGHTSVLDEAVEPTCTTNGLTEGAHCAECGVVLIAQKVVKATGHLWDTGIVTEEPTTTSTGTKVYTCFYCDAEKTETIPKLVVKNGWVTEGGKKYYYKNGTMLKWRQKIDGKFYYFNGAGVMQKGWIRGNTWMYGDLTTGALKTGWFKVGGKWYLFDASGSMLSGWQKNGGKWYYFNSSGAMVTGWQKIGAAWYLFAGSGAMLTGWQKSGGSWYYFPSSGAMATGWQKISGKWYYFESSGAMRTAALKEGGKTYYFNSSGACTNP